MVRVAGGDHGLIQTLHLRWDDPTWLGVAESRATQPDQRRQTERTEGHRDIWTGRDRHTYDRQAGRETDRRDRQGDRETGRQIGRLSDREPDQPRYIEAERQRGRGQHHTYRHQCRETT